MLVDVWWNEVTGHKLRAEALSKENYFYLHGKRVEGCQLFASAEERAGQVLPGHHLDGISAYWSIWTLSVALGMVADQCFHLTGISFFRMEVILVIIMGSSIYTD